MRSSDRNNDRTGMTGLPSRITGLAVGLMFLVVLTACGGSSGSGGASEDSNESAPDTAPIVVDVEMTDNAFVPSAITVAVGQQVEFALKNSGAAIHDMRIENTEFKSEVVINPGATSSFSALFTEAGVYTFVCDYHLPSMVGTITVEE